MVKDFKIYKFGLLLGFLFLPVFVFGQDLGSTSGLFNNPKSENKNDTKENRAKAEKRGKQKICAEIEIGSEPNGAGKNAAETEVRAEENSSRRQANSETAHNRAAK